MAKFEIGDLVVLKSGSMRMLVETVHEDETVSTVWCNEGVIGRDRFAEPLLNKWEHREEERPARGGARPRGTDDRPPRGRGADDRPPRGRSEDRGPPKPRARAHDDDKGDRPPRAKTGWDGKPREKKYFRKDS